MADPTCTPEPAPAGELVSDPEQFTPDPADVEQVAEALGGHRNGLASDGRGWYRSREDRDDCFEAARAVLAALAEAGRLQPAPVETRTEYNVRWRGGVSGRWVVDDALATAEPDLDWDVGNDCHQVHRTVTTYPDGSYLVGPWLPVPTKETP